MSAAIIERRAVNAPRLIGIIGGGLLVLTGVLCLATGVHDTFAGDNSDAIVESIWAVALLLSPVTLSSSSRALDTRPRVAGRLILVGQAAIALAILATVVAGHEVWNAVYIAGFGITIVATLTFAVLTRRWIVLLLLPALVLALAFFTAGGPILLGAAWLAVDQAPSIRAIDL
jgi:hypothetical protein